MPTNSDIILERIASSFQKREADTDQRLYLELYNHLRSGILSHDLPSKVSLPPTRKLAAALAISRSTVVKAYDLLKLEGYIEARVGSGYCVKFVEDSLPTGQKVGFSPFEYPEISAIGQSFLQNVNLINSTSDKSIAFRPGLPPLDIFPVNQWKNLTNLYWRHIKSSALSYSPSSGIIPLKKNIATYLNITRGIKCDDKQVIIVSGSLQSLYLIGNVLINEGDQVVMENPTFPNVHSIFKSLRANIHAVQIDQEGICLDALPTQADFSPKVIHTVPSNHYPTGVRMSMERRQALLDWAHAHKSFIIENDYEHEIGNWHKPMPALFSMDQEDRVIYMGTFNRLLHPSVRLGYMVVPYYLLNAVEALQSHSHRFVSPSLQIVMNQFIEKKYLYQHVQHVIEVAAERKSLFEETFAANFQREIELCPREGANLYVLAKSKKGMDDRQVVSVLEKGNIIAHPYSKCFIDGHAENGLILGYASVRNPVIRKTIPRMARLWREHFH